MDASNHSSAHTSQHTHLHTGKVSPTPESKPKPAWSDSGSSRASINSNRMSKALPPGWSSEKHVDDVEASHGKPLVSLELRKQPSAHVDALPPPPKAAPEPVLKDEWVKGDPGPFGLLCFGMTTCMLMFITTEWTDKQFLPTVFCYAMFYGGFGQFVAGALELIKGNTFGGTAFASYGAFWMGWFLLEYLSWTNKAMFPGVQSGKSLWCGLWAVLTFGFFIVTCRKNGCLMTIFSTLVITFSLLSGGVWSHDCEHAAGYFGFFCGASAIYAAFAFLYKAELGILLPGVRPVHFI